MNIRPIRSDKDYHEALERVESLMDAKPGSEDEDTLDVLATLVEAYEKRICPIDPPDPIDALRYYMESRGVSSRQLEACIGSRARVNTTWPLYKAASTRSASSLSV